MAGKLCLQGKSPPGCGFVLLTTKHKPVGIIQILSACGQAGVTKERAAELLADDGPHIVSWEGKLPSLGSQKGDVRASVQGSCLCLHQSFKFREANYLDTATPGCVPTERQVYDKAGIRLELLGPATSVKLHSTCMSSPKFLVRGCPHCLSRMGMRQMRTEWRTLALLRVLGVHGTDAS